MIYLIDDKVLRQSQDYGWPKNKLEGYKEVLTVIHTNRQLQEYKQHMFEKENVIIFHESFFSNPKNKTDKKSDQLNQDLLNIAEKKGVLVFLFSGSNSSRSVNGKTATTYPSNIYSNLPYFIKKYKESSKNVSVEDLLFGENKIKEKLLINKKKIWELLYHNMGEIQLTPKLQSAIDEFNELTDSSIKAENTDINFIKFQMQSYE